MLTSLILAVAFTGQVPAGYITKTMDAAHASMPKHTPYSFSTSSAASRMYGPPERSVLDFYIWQTPSSSRMVSPYQTRFQMVPSYNIYGQRSRYYGR